MSKRSIVTFKLGQLAKRYPRYTYGLLILAAVALVSILFFIVQKSRLPDSVWLPDASKHTSDYEILNLPVRADTVVTKYGRAVRYASRTANDYAGSRPATLIYVFNASTQLKPSACPNIANIDPLLPSGCDKLGEFQGSPAYGIDRRLPSGAHEYFTTVDGVFIYIKTGGDGVRSLDYLKSLQMLPRDSVSTYLAANNKKVKQLLAKREAEKAATDHNNALAYTHLQFTPVLAGSVPEGWDISGNNPKQIGIDGPNAHTPKLINTRYSSKSNSSITVSWHVGKLSDFKIGTTCGPSPGYSMEHLTCYRVPGTDYYEAILYDKMNDFVRYVYYPVGDSLVISCIVAYAGNDGKRPGWPAELVKAQDLITASAKPVNLADLKGSTFYKTYYY